MAARVLPTSVTSMLLGVGGATVGAGVAGTPGAGVAGSQSVAAQQTARTSADSLVVFAHGGHFPPNGTMIIPEGTTVTFARSFGSGIDTGEVEQVVESLDQAIPAAGAYGEDAVTMLSGSEIPNMFLDKPGAANNEVFLDPRIISVTQLVKLSDFLKPNMGHVIIGACTKILTSHP